MGKVSFTDAGKTATKKTAKKKAAAKKTAKKSTPPAKTEKNLPAKTTSTPIIQGDIDNDDIRLPRLNIVNAMSDLHTEDDFPIGCFVLDKELQLCDKDGELEFIVLGLRKLYQQKLPYDSDESPLVLETVKEVKEEGGTTNWSRDAVEEMRFFEPLAHIILGIKAPEGIDEGEQHRFPYDFDGELWARAVVTVNGSSYKAFAKNIITKAMVMQGQGEGLHHAGWVLKSSKRTSDKGTWFVPQSKFAGIVTDPEAVEFLDSLLSATSLDETDPPEEADEE